MKRWYVKANGPRGDLTVHWKGDPQFPVTMIYAPDTCPSGVNCVTVTQNFTSASNPLVFKGAVWCIGNIPQQIFFDYSVRLRDASGVESNRVKATMTCVP